MGKVATQAKTACHDQSIHTHAHTHTSRVNDVIV